jgi:flagellar hook-length control protein FliK
MIGNGIAALASTTALAPTGRDARASARSGGEFADTLDRALRKEIPAGQEEAKSQTGEVPSAKGEGGRAPRHDLFASTGWHSVADTQASAVLQEPAAKDAAAEEAGSDEKAEKAMPSTGEPTAETVDKEQDAAGISADAAADTAEPVKTVNAAAVPAVAAAGGGTDPTAAGAKDAVEEAPLDKPSRDGPAAVETRSASPEPGEGRGDAHVVGKAGATAAASVEVDRTKRSTPAGKPGSGNDSPVAKAVSEEPETGRTAYDRTTGSVEKPVIPAPRSGVQASSGSARDGMSAVSPARGLAAKSDDTAKNAGVPEARATRETAPDRATTSVAPTTRPDTVRAAPASAIEKPVSPAPVVQMGPPTVATGDTPATGQVAEAVARDLEELAPTRVAVSAGGAPGRPVRSIQLQLNPADLGVVNIRLHSVGGELRITIRAESDQTAEMLSRDSDTIRSALRAAGISTPEITISVNRHDQAAQQFAGQHRDASGQAAGQDNRGNTSNESRNPNREGSSDDARGAIARGDADPGDADRNSRIFI